MSPLRILLVILPALHAVSVDEASRTEIASFVVENEVPYPVLRA